MVKQSPTVIDAGIALVNLLLMAGGLVIGAWLILMNCRAVGLWVWANTVLVAHVGDSILEQRRSGLRFSIGSCLLMTAWLAVGSACLRSAFVD